MTLLDEFLDNACDDATRASLVDAIEHLEAGALSRAVVESGRFEWVLTAADRSAVLYDGDDDGEQRLSLDELLAALGAGA